MVKSGFHAWVTLLFLASCGGGGGDGGDSSPPPPTTLAGLQADIQASINGAKGNEITIPSTASSLTYPGAGILHFDYAMNGFAFCHPSAAFPVVSSNPVPPANRYGCVNDLALTLTQTAPNTLQATFTLAGFFADMGIVWSPIPALVPGGSSPVSASATNVTGGFTLLLSNLSGGAKQVSSVAPASVTVTLNGFDASFSDPAARLYLVLNGAPVAPTVKGPVESALASGLETFLNARMATYPAFVP